MYTSGQKNLKGCEGLLQAIYSVQQKNVTQGMLKFRNRSTETNEGSEITEVHPKQARVAKKLSRYGLSTKRRFLF